MTPRKQKAPTGPRMLDPMEARCAHCGARPKEPCKSVGGNIALSPHMRRLGAFKASGGVWTEQLRECYARDVVSLVFGRCDEYLLARAKKEFGIVLGHSWVKKALGEMPETRRTAAGRWIDPSQETLL